MYLRFTAQFINSYGETETGIFTAAKYLREDYSFTKEEDLAKLNDLSVWFNTYLEKPTKFSHASNKNPESISLSWFKDSAKEHIQNIFKLVKIVESYDIVVEKFTTDNPGYIVYEDDFQVSAVPFKADRNKVK